MPRIPFHPEKLFSLSTFFGVQAKDYASARILEIGCGFAKELIAIASQLPNSTCIGIDVSDLIIEEAQQYAKSLELKNLTLKRASILEITLESFGKFDYIIVQNVFSSVCEDTQKAIFALFEQLLMPNGIAYISYNTLPGWNMAKSVREIVQYHTQSHYIPSEKLRQARLLITFLRDNIRYKNSAYRSLLNEELLLLEDENYFFSDYLSEHNSAYYFESFIQKAKLHKLQYLSDSNIETMFIGNFSENVGAQFKELSHDIIKTEQYLDFLTNRRFRMTLLCREGISINRNLKPENLRGFYLKSSFSSKVPIDSIIAQSGTLYHFLTASAIEFKTKNAIELTFLKILASEKIPLKEGLISKKILANLRLPKNEESIIAQTILTTALRLVLAGAIEIYATQRKFTSTLSEMPKTSDLVKLEAKHGNKVTSQLAESIIIDDFGRLLIQYLDGKHDQKTLIEKMMLHFEKNELTFSANTQAIPNRYEIKQYVQERTHALLTALADHALLLS